MDDLVDDIPSHHALAWHEVVLLLETDAHTGLTSKEARTRLERYGPNVLPEIGTGGSVIRFIRQFHHPLVYVLLIAGVVTLLLEELVDSAVIFGVVVINAVVGFIQESKAEAALDALRSMVRTDARIRRDGIELRVDSADLVPGDLILLEAGDKVPADLRLISATDLEVDESALTGESLPVSKNEVVLAIATPVADRRNMLYSGTLITSGIGTGVVVATGAETELGEIHRLVGTADNLATPLTRKLAWFSRVLTVAILALALVTLAVGVARGEQFTEMITAAVALAVGAIPEGLPAAVTITLAIGVNRMARRKAVIRRMPAVETLGSTTVICSDKTGTLTENQMTVLTVWTLEGRYNFTGTGYQPKGEILDEKGEPVTVDSDQALRWTLIAGGGCNEAELQFNQGTWGVIGDPTEGAMLVAAEKAGIDRSEIEHEFPRVATIPFNPQRKYMATQHRDSRGASVILAKGAVESILELCDTQLDGDGKSVPLSRQRVLDEVDRLAGEGLRVLATATRQSGKRELVFDPDLLRSSMSLTGLQAMQDPPRPAAIDAVKTCHRAGIGVKMITGDHLATAAAVAQQLHILADDGDEKVLSGVELESLSASELPYAVECASVFARVTPEQKLRLVDGLQGRGNVVAMTGDGVNDAPALQQADIGIAMGKSGTEVAKEASDMVLTDDNFATIEAAIEEGRGVFDNLTKFIVWTLPTNMGEGLVILLAILVGGTLPITPVQILWINMTTAVGLGLMLAFEPKEPEIMERPPRDPARPLLTTALMTRILLVSSLLVGGTWWLFRWEETSGASLEAARTAALNLFVAVEAFYLFNCRSLRHSVWHVGFFSNRWIIGGVSIQLLAQIAITYQPTMNAFFGTAPISLAAWARILVLSSVAAVIVGVDKWLRKVLTAAT